LGGKHFLESSVLGVQEEEGFFFFCVAPKDDFYY